MSKWELLDLFRKDKQAALDYVLDAGAKSIYGCARLYHSYQMTDKPCRAGSYHGTTRKGLEGRTYEIEFVNDSVALHFTDRLYDMRTFKHVPIGPERNDDRTNQA